MGIPFKDKKLIGFLTLQFLFADISIFAKPSSMVLFYLKIFYKKNSSTLCLRDYKLEVIESPQYGALESSLSPDLEGLLSNLSLSVNGVDIIPRQYQLEGLSHTLSQEKSLLLSPTASGKSLIIYLAIRYYLDVFDGNVLLIVPTTSLVEQMYSDFGDYSRKDTWSHEENCHRIYSGREKIGVSQRIIISTWQSIYKLPASWFNSFGMVIGDEAHNFKAKSLTSIFEKCTEAKYRIGTTGTLDGTQTHQLVLEGLFGPSNVPVVPIRYFASVHFSNILVNDFALKLCASSPITIPKLLNQLAGNLYIDCQVDIIIL
jgi:hypothetical protein